MHAPPVLVITAEYDPPREKDEFCATPSEAVNALSLTSQLDMRAGPGVCIRSPSRIRALAPLAGALRRLRIVGGVGIVFGYSRDEPASGERLQVRLQCVSNLLGIDLPVVHVERKGFQILFLLRRI